MPSMLERYDDLLRNAGPAAVVVKQWLRPVGDDGFFPPTYASAEGTGERAGYCVDRFKNPDGSEHSVCVVDSIQSQANRIEPAFEQIAGGRLVPKVVVHARWNDGTIESKNLLEVGHRLADAVVRFSSLSTELKQAIAARLGGDSLPLAKLGPTSLLFGMWDSRDSGMKVPRLLNSIIRAYDVNVLHRNAQFFAAISYGETGVEPGRGEKALSEVGMDDVPAPSAYGGIEARGGVCRDASLNLCTLRDIVAKEPHLTLALQRYMLGLALVALTYLDGKTLNLRQGCQLVARTDRPMSRVLVKADGTEEPFDIDAETAVQYAVVVAEAFGVGPDRLDVKFDPKAAKASLKKSKKDSEEQ